MYEINPPIIYIDHNGTVSITVDNSYTSNKTIAYTTDGSIPTTSHGTTISNENARYNEIGTFPKGTIIKAIVYNNDKNVVSEIATEIVFDSINNTTINIEQQNDVYTIDTNGSDKGNCGTIFVVFDNSDPITNGVEWCRNKPFDNGNIYRNYEPLNTEKLNVNIKLVRKYGDYISEIFAYNFGKGYIDLPKPEIIANDNITKIINPIYNQGYYDQFVINITDITGKTEELIFGNSEYIVRTQFIKIEAKLRVPYPEIVDNKYEGNIGYRYSETAIYEYIVEPPQFSFEDTKVKIYTISEGKIYYKLNNEQNYILYDGNPLEVDGNTIIEAYNVVNGEESKHITYTVPRYLAEEPAVNLTEHLIVTNYESEKEHFDELNYNFKCTVTYPASPAIRDDRTITVEYIGNSMVLYNITNGKIATIKFEVKNELNRLISTTSHIISEESYSKTLEAPIIEKYDNDHVRITNPNDIGIILYTPDDEDPTLPTTSYVYESTSKSIIIVCSENQIITAAIKYNNVYNIYSELTQYTHILLKKPIITQENRVYTITNPNSNGTIYYAVTNNFGEKYNYQIYTAPFELEEFYEIRAYVKDGNDESNYTSLFYENVENIVKVPSINISAGLVTIINNDDELTKLYYKIGNPIYIPIDSDIEIKEYNEPFVIENNTYVYTVAIRNDKYSEIVSALYTKDIILDDGIIIPIYDSEDKFLDTTIFKNFVDVMFSDNYELAKTINAISYILNSIINNFDLNKPSEENLNRRYSGDNLIIYNDETTTGLLDINCDKEINILNNYKYPYWDKGKWNLNYFRNTVATATKPTDSDNQSLIYGKYFVIRFIFNNDRRFKLETIEPNINIY